MHVKRGWNEAAKESNLPSGGFHRPAGFEGQMGHQTRAAPPRRLSADGPEGAQVPAAEGDPLAIAVFEDELGGSSSDAE